MKIRFTTSVAGTNFAYQHGEVHDLRADVAKDFLRTGVAVVQEDAPETAVRSAPENAMRPRAGKRGQRALRAIGNLLS